MRKVSFILAAAMLMVSAAVMAQQASKVYLTREISPESLVKIYKALGVEAKGRVAVKMSTGEGSNPEPVKLEDYGILASTDPVALDQACIDIINQQKVTAKNDPTDLLKRIDKQHGTHTIDHAAQIGLGSKMYELVNLDL